MKRGDWREYNRIRIVNTDARALKKAAQNGLLAARDLAVAGVDRSVMSPPRPHDAARRPLEAV